ncbi:MAG: flagellar basal body rod protein FlgC [Gammaproteobacteria bacterium]|nr:flagellar basal body rod protein FlgC [Gammaproteobacteria bacterium]
MSLFRIFEIAGSGMNAQTVRLNVTASNVANADNVSGDAASAYRARQPVFSSFADAMNGNENPAVRVLGIVESKADIATRYAPDHPNANDEGYVFSSNVNAIEEMVNMLSASRSYQNNIEVINTSKELLMRTLSMGQ